MTFQPVAATAQVEMRQALFGQEIENVYHFRSDSPFSVADLTVLASDMITWWATNIAPLVVGSLTLTEVVCTALHASTGPQFVATVSPAEPGTVAQNGMPSNLCACISLRTALIGRAFRGRNFLAGLGEGQVTDNTISSTVLDGYIDAYGLLIDGTATPAFDYVLVTRQVDGVVQMPTALTNHITTALFVTPFARTMRRRTAGVGS